MRQTPSSVNQDPWMTPTHTDLEELTHEDLAFLDENRFDHKIFKQLREELIQGQRHAGSNLVTSLLHAPRADDLTPWPTSNRLARVLAAGHDQCNSGNIGIVILNGGMATRFGHVVKGAIEIAPGLSLIGLRLALTAQASPNIPIFVMNSFATAKATQEHLEANHYFGVDPNQVHLLTQSISLRLDPSGNIFRTPDGRISPYAPGHGDVFETLAHAPAFREFVAKGGKSIMISNVDNPVATLNPAVIGMHLNQGHAVTVEVTDRRAGETGGSPAWLDGRLCVVEGFRFPPTFDQTQFSVFNTNTITIDVGAVRAQPLNWYYVEKKVDGHTVIQFERLMGEITSFVSSAYLRVPRSGSQNRFLPIKTPEDLPEARTVVAEFIEGRRLGWASRGLASHSAA